MLWSVFELKEDVVGRIFKEHTKHKFLDDIYETLCIAKHFLLSRRYNVSAYRLSTTPKYVVNMSNAEV